MSRGATARRGATKERGKRVMAEDDDEQRRREEWTALCAIYGENAVVGAEDALEWKVSLGERCGWLEVHLPQDYPSSGAPAPVILVPGLQDASKETLAQELLALWDHAEVVYEWAEHLREAVPSLLLAGNLAKTELADAASAAAAAAVAAGAEAEAEAAAGGGGGFTFEPPTAKYGQRVRHFDSAALDPAHAVELTSGEPFHPSHGGPGETFKAHVAAVHSMAEVQWAVCTLLQDRRVARATHNMIAYRFWDGQRSVQVADNDDDGEATAGQKLAGLLDLMGAQNVLVVVSRWFGGVHLGPARFKYLANTARELLDACGHGAERKTAGGTGGPRTQKSGDRKKR